MQNFMQDRYGADELTTVLGMGGMLLALMGSLFQLDALLWCALALVIIALVRALSKNGEARMRENRAFITSAQKIPGVRTLVQRLSATVGAPDAAARTAGRHRTDQNAAKAERDRAMRTAKQMWSKRKTSRFLKCPTCGQILSVPKGKGKIRVTCPKCHTKMETKS